MGGGGSRPGRLWNSGVVPLLLAVAISLYYAYSLFASDFRAFGDGLRSRQHLRDQLEIATNNPRDADAHYQLGLIYQKRRQYTDAIARFERAVAIDASGCRPAPCSWGASRSSRAATRMPSSTCRRPLHSTTRPPRAKCGATWGAACFQTARFEEAAAALEKYAARRPYDPEGLYWLGRTHASLGHADRARECFEECIEAVQTSPRHRRALVRKWARQSQSALRASQIDLSPALRKPRCRWCRCRSCRRWPWPFRRSRAPKAWCSPSTPSPPLWHTPRPSQ